MISKSKGQVKAYGPGNPDSLLSFGSGYYSIKDVSKITPTFFIIHFLNYKVRVYSVKTAVIQDVYPLKWNLSISNDNITYRTLIDGGQPLCSETNRELAFNGYHCKSQENIITQVTKNNWLTGNYVRFDLIENTYNYEVNPNYRQLI